MTTNIKYALCTLFDSNYLDKGLVLYQSLEKYASHFTLYVLAMNDKCYEVLTALNYEHLIPIKLSDFENEGLLRVKPERGVGEYCWTCSSSLIKYVLDSFQPDFCSYVDADMAFYSDPIVLLEEMEERGASVSIVGHRFNKMDQYRAKIVGRYCVECNTFKNDKDARMLLDIWIGQCLDHCSIDGDGIYWADQKYMDNWVSDYEFVIETNNLGAGVAPWNISQYRKVDGSQSNIELLCKGKRCNLLFYHFENLKYITLKNVNIGVYNTWGIQDSLVNFLYDDYLSKIDAMKFKLKKEYNIDVIIKVHPGVTSKKEKSKNYRMALRKYLLFFYTTLPAKLFGGKNIKTVK